MPHALLAGAHGFLLGRIGAEGCVLRYILAKANNATLRHLHKLVLLRGLLLQVPPKSLLLVLESESLIYIDLLMPRVRGSKHVVGWHARCR